LKSDLSGIADAKTEAWTIRLALPVENKTLTAYHKGGFIIYT